MLTLLDGFHVADHSPLRAAIVGALCSGIGYLLVRKLIGGRDADGGDT
ncbi:hypothetical protein [Sphingomonas sp.]|nr:hypothetical protein [Sphingomonas sp.]MBA4760237.1 hypothetical protein [Sphingomonas sp.]